MHFVMGELVEIYEENGVPMGKVRVGGSIIRAVLAFLPEAKVGETVFVHAGIALSRLGLGTAKGSLTEEERSPASPLKTLQGA